MLTNPWRAPRRPRPPSRPAQTSLFRALRTKQPTNQKSSQKRDQIGRNRCRIGEREEGTGALTVVVGGREGVGQDEELEEEAGGEEEDRQPVPAHLRWNRHLRECGRKRQGGIGVCVVTRGLL